MKNFNDTICAIATPQGSGALSLIRVSGKNAINVVSSVFEGPKNIKEVAGNSIIHGKIKNTDKKNIIDEVVLYIYRPPASYTGEEMVEISTHGGTVVPRNVLRTLLSSGCRMAEPGEFTKRRFLNNKMTLLEAEALLNVVNAKTGKAAKIAEDNLNGKLRDEVEKIREGLIKIKSLIEAEIDFGEIEILKINKEEIEKEIKSLKEKVKFLVDSYEGGRILTDGINIAIVGKPNVGKSSLFNTILQEDRAIVTEEPGTTRDTLKGAVDIEGYTVIFHDMAGIRETSSSVERIGVDRALNLTEKSDAVLFILDGSEKIDEGDRQIFNIIAGKPYITVINKDDLQNRIGNIPFKGDTVYVSAREHSGIEEINRKVVDLIEKMIPTEEESPVCTTERQRDGLEKALELLENARGLIENDGDIELIAFDIEEAIGRIKELTGDVTNEEILDKIFSNFCIGK